MNEHVDQAFGAALNSFAGAPDCTKAPPDEAPDASETVNETMSTLDKALAGFAVTPDEAPDPCECRTNHRRRILGEAGVAQIVTEARAMVTAAANLLAGRGRLIGNLDALDGAMDDLFAVVELAALDPDIKALMERDNADD